MTLDRGTALPSHDENLQSLRAQLPASTLRGYFNAGTNGPIPLVAHQAMVDRAEDEMNLGRIGPGLYEGMFADLTRLRDLLAEIFGADGSEIALMRSTAEGMNVALMGMEWRRGDEIITTQLEHVCLFSALGLLSHREGVVIKTVDIGNGEGDVVDQLERSVTPRTRAIAISHVQWSSGAIMPLKATAEMARPRGIMTIIDAAQAAGQIEVDLHDLGVDAYAVAGQKWLCGPGGSGALYVRADRMGEIRPTYLRYGAFDPHGFVVPPAGAARYEMGEAYNPSVRAQEAGLRFLKDDVGFAWLYERIAALGVRLWDGLQGIPGLTVTTPRDRMAGLVCFAVAGMTPKDVDSAVFERGYTIRFVDQRPGPAVVRVSTGWWCTEEEVDGLIAAVQSVAAGT
ncbi:MAG: aminotransferase class V-fold PLP-dependent enzyme [Thermomicrobiales bacterium]